MKKHSRFTAEQIALLKSNSYTQGISEYKINFSEEFYLKASVMLENGYSISAILSLLGYDTTILGKDRASALRKRLARRINETNFPVKETEIICDEKLRSENIMLKQQLSFLKKIISKRTGQELGK